MADEHKITTTFEANIDQFSKATQQMNHYMGGINAQFRNATASMDKWSDSTDGLEAKLTQLDKTLKLQEKDLLRSQDAYNKLVAEGKGASKEAQTLALKITNQQTAIKKTNKEIDHYESNLKELKDAGVSTRKELDKLNKEAEEGEEAFKNFGNSLATGVVAGIAGIATACVGALKGLSSLVDSTAELRTEQGRVKTAFEDAGFSADFALSHMDKFYAVLGDTRKTTETLQQLALFAKSEEEVAQYTDILTGVFAKLGDSLPTESLAEGINHTIQLGHEIGVQGGLADALEWAGVSVEDFNKKLEKCSTEEERSKLINEQLTKSYGASAEAYKENNKDIIEATMAQSEYNNKMAELANKVAPAMNNFKLKMLEVLDKVLEKFEEVDIEGILTKIGDVITSLVDNVLPPLMNVLSWVLDNLTWLAPAIMGVVSGIMAGVVAFKAITLAVNIYKIAQMGLNAVMMANPIGLVATAIGVLVGAFVILWNKCEGFRKFWKQLWDDIKAGVSKAVEGIKTIVEGIINTIKNVVNGVIKLINGAIKGINKISVTIPDWVPEFGGKKIGFNIPTIPLLAKGGIVDQATLAMIGEKGKEAIVPLENNTQWIDTLADKLGSKMQSSNVVNNYSFDYKFEGMETTRYALHKAQMETKRVLGGL